MPGSQLQLSAPERAMLVAPDRVARAAAAVMLDGQQRWMLRQPREVRRSFATEVLARGGGSPLAQERWMLLQPEAIRHSYVREVLDPAARREHRGNGPAAPPPARPSPALLAAGAGGALAVAGAVAWLLLG